MCVFSQEMQEDADESHCLTDHFATNILMPDGTGQGAGEGAEMRNIPIIIGVVVAPAAHGQRMPKTAMAQEKGDRSLLCEESATDRRLVGPFGHEVPVPFFEFRHTHFECHWLLLTRATFRIPIMIIEDAVNTTIL